MCLWGVYVFMGRVCVYGACMCLWGVQVFMGRVCVYGACVFLWGVYVFMGRACVYGACMCVWGVYVFMGRARATRRRGRDSGRKKGNAMSAEILSHLRDETKNLDCLKPFDLIYTHRV